MTDWNTKLGQVGVFWQNDGHPKRPNALLTSGRISGDFADTTFAMARPRMIAEAAVELATWVELHYPDLSKLVICGQMEGSVTLASRIAEELDVGFAYTAKVGEDADKKMVLAERFEGIFPEDSLIILVEDTSTTTGTSNQSREGLKESGYMNVSSDLLTIVDRTGGTNEHRFCVVSCCVPEDFPSWTRGQNPHTPDGEESVEPVRAKTKAGRQAMRGPLPD